MAGFSALWRQTNADLQPTDPVYELHDHRRSNEPLAALAKAREAFPAALVWSEGERVAGAVNRLGLRSSETLIVWTIPPSAEVWAAALATVNPSRIIVFGRRPQTGQGRDFPTRLAALIKFAVNKREGKAGLEVLAAALGERERSVQVGLQVLHALGKLDFQLRATGQVELDLNEAAPSEQARGLQKRLSLLLRETRAYRNYWLTMKIQE